MPQQQKSKLLLDLGAVAAEVQHPAASVPMGKGCRKGGATEQQGSFCQGSYFKPSTLWVALLAPKSV